MQEEKNDKVPLFRKWQYWYWLVLGFLLVLIILFYCFTKHYA